ncbi:MAG: Hypoxanthine phosphoribosyltransferase [Myxococcota bacterium]|nr:Hypoxanthine phosphoribosyltransferase [Myxococcota bacterium]
MYRPREISEILFDETAIQKRVAELGREISLRFPHGVHVVSVLKGSFVFTADLIRRIEVPVTVDFIGVSSYGAGTSSSGQVREVIKLQSGIEGKSVLVVEDIVDSGITAAWLMEKLGLQQPRELALCSFLDKPSRRTVNIRPDYLGFSIADRFVVGYGLDFDSRYRHLPYIGVFDPRLDDKV